MHFIAHLKVKNTTPYTHSKKLHTLPSGEKFFPKTFSFSSEDPQNLVTTYGYYAVFLIFLDTLCRKSNEESSSAVFRGNFAIHMVP